MFESFPKIPRLKREVVITEKIDGTNAQVYVAEEREPDDCDGFCIAEVGGLYVYAGSRNRWVKPGADNYGWAAWVQANAEELATVLGPGRHFGEWWGAGIQRRYGLSEKRFSLFNSARWGEGRQTPPTCCSVVPVLATGDWTLVGEVLELLRVGGSVAAPGFMKPEGIVVYHSASRSLFKVTLDADEQPKGQTE